LLSWVLVRVAFDTAIVHNSVHGDKSTVVEFSHAHTMPVLLEEGTPLHRRSARLSTLARPLGGRTDALLGCVADPEEEAA
jgi:hypothetical protein